MSRRRIRILVAVVAVFGLALAAIAGWGSKGDLGSREKSFLARVQALFSGRNEPALRVSGNIELVDVEVSFKIGGRVVERLVDEGELVEGGQRIAVLENEDLKKDVEAKTAAVRAAQAAWEEIENGSREEEIKAAEAAQEAAAQRFLELQHGSRPQEIEAAEAALQSAQAERTRLADELERAKKLFFQDRVLAEEDYKRQEAAFQIADARWREASQRATLVRLGPRDEQKLQAKAALDQATWQCRLVKAGARREVRDQAKAKLDEAKAALELAATRLRYSEAFAPPIPRAPWAEQESRKWVVLSKNVEPGEYVAPGTPVVTIGDLARPWLRAYIDAENHDKVKYGQRARVFSNLMPGKSFEGRVGFIASEAEFTPKNVQTEKERTKLVYRIKIYVDNPNLELKRGMPADAEILLEEP
jgi:HlyD family secretion protein